MEIEQLRVKPKSKKAQRHQEKRARARRRQEAKYDARYAGATFRTAVAERIRENNRPKPKKIEQKPTEGETVEEKAAS